MTTEPNEITTWRSGHLYDKTKPELQHDNQTKAIILSIIKEIIQAIDMIINGR